MCLVSGNLQLFSLPHLKFEIVVESKQEEPNAYWILILLCQTSVNVWISKHLNYKSYLMLYHKVKCHGTCNSSATDIFAKKWYLETV